MLGNDVGEILDNRSANTVRTMLDDGTLTVSRSVPVATVARGFWRTSGRATAKIVLKCAEGLM